ncbi:DUF3221 domain-containing protein [Rossellomorea sp. YZS02]|uniref:DUF3221 domain-containing protein n=1 Tax=Rossellomorea sp. YZS02 TaxID=3097358 RepID=UPI002A11E654|nr:DUF3221 domain-containing protein [Rossellomorea sp. YZS02]MDX8344174.1 DUF3221 domain-containing protein [Rossellomorea sp. YZS02]
MSYKSKSLFVLLLSIVTLLLSGCFNSHYDGVIGAKNDEFHRVLVIQNVSNGLIEDKEIGEIIKIAQEHDGIWFGVQKETYENLNIGDEVKVEYSENSDTAASDPPIMGAKDIKVLK